MARQPVVFEYICPRSEGYDVMVVVSGEIETIAMTSVPEGAGGFWPLPKREWGRWLAVTKGNGLPEGFWNPHFFLKSKKSGGWIQINGSRALVLCPLLSEWHPNISV